MFAAAGWIPRTGIQHHRAKVVIGASAEFTGEVAADSAFVGFVATSVRIVLTRIQHERAEIVILHSAMNAVERPFLVALEERVFAAPFRMVCARIQEQRPRVVVPLSAVSAKFVHISILLLLLYGHRPGVARAHHRTEGQLDIDSHPLARRQGQVQPARSRERKAPRCGRSSDDSYHS